MPAVLLGSRAELIETWLTAADRRRIDREVADRLQHHPRDEQDEAVDRFFALSIAAGHRLRDARVEWAAEHGLTWWEAGRLIAAEREGRRGAST